MHGADCQTAAMFSHLSPEAMVPAGHPLRLIRPIVNAALMRLSGDFDKLYATGGRDSIAPRSCSAPCWCRRSSRCGPSGD